MNERNFHKIVTLAIFFRFGFFITFNKFTAIMLFFLILINYKNFLKFKTSSHLTNLKCIFISLVKQLTYSNVFFYVA